MSHHSSSPPPSRVCFCLSKARESAPPQPLLALKMSQLRQLAVDGRARGQGWAEGAVGAVGAGVCRVLFVLRGSLNNGRCPPHPRPTTVCEPPRRRHASARGATDRWPS